MHHQRLSKSDDSLLRAHAATQNHDKVIVDFTVMRKATQRGDCLLCQIVLSGGVVLDNLAVFGVDTLTNTVDLLVDLGSVVVALLTSASHGEAHSAGMPCSNTRHLTQTLVRLTRQFLGVPPGCNTLESFALGDTYHINHLVTIKDFRDWDLFFKMFTGPVNLLSNGTTIQLDFHNMSLLLALLHQLHLCVGNHTDDFAVFLHLVEVFFNLLLSQVILPFLGVLGESLLLGAVPEDDKRGHIGKSGLIMI